MVPRKKKKRREKWSGLAKWMKEHPGERLPQSSKELARIAGLTIDQVKTFMYRERHMKKELLEKAIGLIREFGSAVLTLEDGEEIAVTAKTDMRAGIDWWTLGAYIEVGPEKKIAPVEDPQGLVDRLEAMVSTVTRLQGH